MLLYGDRVIGGGEPGSEPSYYTLLINRACRYHSRTDDSVDFRDKSNINKSAMASLQTKGNMCRNSC